MTRDQRLIGRLEKRGRKRGKFVGLFDFGRVAGGLLKIEIAPTCSCHSCSSLIPAINAPEATQKPLVSTRESNDVYHAISSTNHLPSATINDESEFGGESAEESRQFCGIIMGWMTRFLAVTALFAFGILFSPEFFRAGDESSSLLISLKLVHLLSFATAWGAALWVTFIGGIIMFNNLPRHQFGNLQSKMFPAYFSTVAVCGAMSIGAFAYLHPWKTASSAERFQIGFLLSSFAFNLTNLFVFTPMTIEMMKKRHKVERDENIGEEIGWSKNREVSKVNPKLAAMNKKFGMIHGLSSLANIMSFGSLAMHSWFLAGKIQL